MRRLMVLVSLLALVVPLLMGASVRAQEASPASAVALPLLLQQASETFNAGDAAAVAALYTEVGTHEDIPAEVRIQDRGEITASYDLATILGQLGLLDLGEGSADATPAA
jgi:hypothetical protein